MKYKYMGIYVMRYHMVCRELSDRLDFKIAEWSDGSRLVRTMRYRTAAKP